MYLVLVAVQCIAIAISLYGLVSLLHFRTGKDSRFITMTNLCVIVYAMGYLFRLMSHDLSAACIALCVEYMGVAFLGTLFALFVCEYCNVHFNRNFWNASAIVDMLILFTVITNHHHKIFFPEMYMVDAGSYTYLSIKYSVFYFLFAAKGAGLLILSSVVIFRTIKKTDKLREKRRLVLLSVICFIPFLGFALAELKLIPGYDPSSIIFSVGLLVFSYGLTHWRMVNVVNHAYSGIYKDLEEGVIIADNEGRYLDSNPSASRIFPELRAWDAGATMSELGVELCTFGKNVLFERNGKHYSSVAKPVIENRKQVGWMILISDVSVIHDRMDEVIEQKNEADDASRAKSEFLANMSHEIRTPLNAIIGMAELSEKETNANTVHEYIGQIKNSGKMLLDIISDVLDLSRIEAGKIDINPVEFDLWSLLNSVINVINMRIGDKTVEFGVDIDPEIPRTLFGDDVRISQIMINFLGNAEKYTQRGHIDFKVDCENRSENTITLKVSVEDSGAGIKPDDLEKLFQPFSRVDMKQNRKIVGTGLGLSISASYIEAMDGEYTAKSVYGAGSTFSFEIPVGVIDPEPLAHGVERKRCVVEKLTSFNLFSKIEEKKEDEVIIPEEASFPDARVLVVDDNKVNVKVLSAYLKQLDIIPDVAYGGTDAVKMAEEKAYDLILMDHLMPDMDGSEAASIIRKSLKPWCKDVIIIACTANVQKGADELFIESGMNDYISKPISFDILKRKLVGYLSKDED